MAMSLSKATQINNDFILINLARRAVGITTIDRKDSGSARPFCLPGIPMNFGDLCSGIGAELS